MTNLDVDTGTYAAKRATWRKINPREHLNKIVEDNPTGPETRWRELFHEFLETEPDASGAVVEYWLDNNIRSLLGKEASRKRTKRKTDESETRTEAENLRRKIRDKVAREAQIIVLDLLMPNGKPLGQCTGADCGRFGGWLSALAKTVPPRKKVADVLSEGEARKLWLAKK
jgi:hypothetical protein